MVASEPVRQGPDKPAIILFGHGSRDPEWMRPFHKIRDILSASNPNTAIRLAFLEQMQPTLPAAVSDLLALGYTQIRIAPLFIAAGGHLKRDLPEMVTEITAQHADLQITLLPPVGDVDSILITISDWIAGTAL